MATTKVNFNNNNNKQHIKKMSFMEIGDFGKIVSGPAPRFIGSSVMCIQCGNSRAVIVVEAPELPFGMTFGNVDYCDAYEVTLYKNVNISFDDN